MKKGTSKDTQKRNWDLASLLLEHIFPPPIFEVLGSCPGSAGFLESLGHKGLWFGQPVNTWKTCGFLQLSSLPMVSLPARVELSKRWDTLVFVDNPRSWPWRISLGRSMRQFWHWRRSRVAAESARSFAACCFRLVGTYTRTCLTFVGLVWCRSWRNLLHHMSWEILERNIENFPSHIG